MPQEGATDGGAVWHCVTLNQNLGEVAPTTPPTSHNKTREGNDGSLKKCITSVADVTFKSEAIAADVRTFATSPYPTNVGSMIHCIG